MTGIDARRVLKAYMTHVVECESISFVNTGSDAKQPPLCLLTPPERQMLAEVEAEVMREYNERA